MSVKSQSDHQSEARRQALTLEAFRFIKQYAGPSGIWPSVREVAAELGVGTRSAGACMRSLEGAAGLPKVRRRGRRGNRRDRFWLDLGLDNQTGPIVDPYCTPVDKLIA